MHNLRNNSASCGGYLPYSGGYLTYRMIYLTYNQIYLPYTNFYLPFPLLAHQQNTEISSLVVLSIARYKKVEVNPFYEFS